MDDFDLSFSLSTSLVSFLCISYLFSLNFTICSIHFVYNAFSLDWIIHLNSRLKKNFTNFVFLWHILVCVYPISFHCQILVVNIKLPVNQHFLTTFTCASCSPVLSYIHLLYDQLSTLYLHTFNILLCLLYVDLSRIGSYWSVFDNRDLKLFRFSIVIHSICFLIAYRTGPVNICRTENLLNGRLLFMASLRSYFPWKISRQV